jgi:hypothetical protein
MEHDSVSSATVTATFWNIRGALRIAAARFLSHSWSTTLTPTIILLSTHACNIADTPTVNNANEEPYVVFLLGGTVLFSSSNSLFVSAAKGTED